MQITADISKISGSVQGDVASILNVLSETDVFVQICLVLEIKNLVNLIKTSFYWKQGCLSMCKYVETFECNSNSGECSKRGQIKWKIQKCF